MDEKAKVKKELNKAIKGSKNNLKAEVDNLINRFGDYQKEVKEMEIICDKFQNEALIANKRNEVLTDKILILGEEIINNRSKYLLLGLIFGILFGILGTVLIHNYWFDIGISK